SIASSTAWNLAFGSPTTVADPSASSSDSSSNASTTTDSDSWSVTDVKVKVGDVVTPQQVLATASNATLAFDVAAAKKDVQSANLQHLNAQDDTDNATQPAKTRKPPPQPLSAKTAPPGAGNKWKDLEKPAARHDLVAPAAGIVTGVNLQKGSMAPSGAAITIA